MEHERAAMQRATAGSGVIVVRTVDNALKIEVPGDLCFEAGRADLKPNLRPVLDQFADGVHGHTEMDVRIIGYMDSAGSEGLNDWLALKRAEATRAYLVSHGVDPQHIAAAGRGARDPVADNTTEAGRARNRRIEIYLRVSVAP